MSVYHLKCHALQNLRNARCCLVKLSCGFLSLADERLRIERGRLKDKAYETMDYLSGDTSGVAQMVETAEDGLLRSIIVDMRSFCPQTID